MENRKIWWFRDEGNNTGDLVGPWLLDKLGLNYEFDPAKSFITCGSVLNLALPNSIIWGAGFHNETDTTLASDIRAVRGNLTKKILNLDVPVGDPGLLVSKFYTPCTSKKYKFGIVSHWIDYNDFKNLNCKVINMRRDNSETPIEDVLNDIAECEFIFSSSLHGIIFAHSLGIPAIHIENQPLYSKNNFKFKDYYSIYSDIFYIKEQYSADLNFINKYLNSDKNLYLPSKAEIDKIQKNLLEVFPFES